MKNQYTLRNRKSGLILESGLTHEEAINLLNECEAINKVDGVFTPNFYQIVKVID